MSVRYSRKFTKAYQKADQKIKKVFENRLKLFFQNPFHPTLNNHILKGEYQNCHSINITGDWRAIYSKKGNTFIFEILGTHNQLYK